jgi:hypothetical protein
MGFLHLTGPSSGTLGAPKAFDPATTWCHHFAPKWRAGYPCGWGATMPL